MAESACHFLIGYRTLSVLNDRGVEKVVGVRVHKIESGEELFLTFWQHSR